MKLLSVLLSLCLTFNVLAASGTVGELERQLDEYQYTMTVEWDQKDQAFQERETKAFFEKISATIQSGEVSKEAIMSLAESKIKNNKALEALKLKMTLLSGANSSAELATLLRENSKEFYGQGASWNGNVEMILIGAGVIALIGYLVWWSANHECVEWEEQWECTTDTTTDPYYNSSTTTTNCGWVDVCTSYQKI